MQLHHSEVGMTPAAITVYMLSSQNLTQLLVLAHMTLKPRVGWVSSHVKGKRFMG